MRTAAVTADWTGSQSSLVVMSASAIACWAVIHVATGGWAMGALLAAGTACAVLGSAVRTRETPLASGSLLVIFALVWVGSSAQLQVPVALVGGLLFGTLLFGLGYVVAEEGLGEASEADSSVEDVETSKD